MAVIIQSETAAGVEEYGEVTEVTCVAVVTGCTGAAIGDVWDSALSAVGMPRPGDSWSTGSPHVRLEARRPRIVGQRNSVFTVEVTLEYRLQRPSTDIAFPLRGGGSLNQVVTQVDRNGTPITLFYNDQTVRAEASVLDPRATFSREVIEQTDDPDGIKDAWLNHINSDTFRGQGAGYWLVSNIDYELVDRIADPKRYRFLYDFEGDPVNLHKYTVAYKDANDNIPEDVETPPNAGIVDVDWHPERPFSPKFG